MTATIDHQTAPASTESAAACHLCESSHGPRRLREIRIDGAVVEVWECVGHGPRLGQLADRRIGGRS